MGRKKQTLEKKTKAQRGWIELHRSLMENKIWYMDDHFSKGQAWVDLLMMANHGTSSDKQYKRGHVYTSISYLHRRWNWSKDKVFNFLQFLVDEDMIIVVSKSRKGLIIRVCNYDKYQPKKSTTFPLTESTKKPTNAKPDESKAKTKSQSNKSTTLDDTKPSTNNNNVSLNNKREKEKIDILSLKERVNESVSGGLSDLALDVINRIESGEKIDWQQYGDADGCMDGQIQIIRGMTNDFDEL